MSLPTQLEGFGLSEKEARIYATSLSLGKATIDTLAKSAGILRTTTYTQVARLQELGLLSTITIGKKTYYAPESPENIVRLLDRQKQNLSAQQQLFHDILPTLLSTYKQHNKRPTVRFFAGLDGLLTMRHEVLENVKTELMVVSSYDLFTATIPKSERDAFTKRRRNQKIPLRGLFTSTESAGVLAAAGELEEVRELPHETIQLAFDIYITDDWVYISSLSEEIWGLAIESTAVAASMKSLFLMAWEYAALHTALRKVV